jgi:hypothetical protein
MFHFKTQRSDRYFASDQFFCRLRGHTDVGLQLNGTILQNMYGLLSDRPYHNSDSVIKKSAYRHSLNEENPING